MILNISVQWTDLSLSKSKQINDKKMKHITKLNPGDKLYALKDNCIQSFTVEEINIMIMQSHCHIGNIYTEEKYKLQIGESAGVRAIIYKDEIGNKYFKTINQLITSLRQKQTEK